MLILVFAEDDNRCADTEVLIQRTDLFFFFQLKMRIPQTHHRAHEVPLSSFQKKRDICLN